MHDLEKVLCPLGPTLRILNTEEHWACMVLKKGQTPKKSQAVVFDGLFMKEIMDGAASLTFALMERWFGKEDAEQCVPQWGLCDGQSDAWSCGHRIIITFDTLAGSGNLKLDAPTKLKDITIGPDKFECLNSREDYVKFESALQTPLPSGPCDTPPRRPKRGLPDDAVASPPAVARPRMAEAVPEASMAEVYTGKGPIWADMD